MSAIDNSLLANFLKRAGDQLAGDWEAINQAAAYFLHKIKGWENELVELHSGARAIFYRPNVLLFVKLKVGRLTETDKNDCLAMIRKFAGSLEIDERLRKFVASAQKKSKSKHHSDRLQEILSLLDA